MLMNLTPVQTTAKKARRNPRSNEISKMRCWESQQKILHREYKTPHPSSHLSREKKWNLTVFVYAFGIYESKSCT